MRPLVALKLATKEGIRAAAYRSRNGINASPRYEAEYSTAIWEDVLNHKLRASSAEIQVSPLDMLRERCRDPNVLYDAKEYTLHTYLDSKKMDKPLLVCIHKVMHQEPVFFDTVD